MESRRLPSAMSDCTAGRLGLASEVLTGKPRVWLRGDVPRAAVRSVGLHCHDEFWVQPLGPSLKALIMVRGCDPQAAICESSCTASRVEMKRVGCGFWGLHMVVKGTLASGDSRRSGLGARARSQEQQLWRQQQRWRQNPESGAAGS